MSEKPSTLFTFTIIVSPNLLKILCRFSFVMIHPNNTSNGKKNDFPKLLIITPFNFGLPPCMLVVFRFRIFFPIVWPVVNSEIVQYTKNKILVGMYCMFSAQKTSLLISIVPKTAKIIPVEITEMMIKSTNHARNLSVHFARMISVDESELLIILPEQYIHLLYTYTSFLTLEINSPFFNII